MSCERHTKDAILFMLSELMPNETASPNPSLANALGFPRQRPSGGTLPYELHLASYVAPTLPRFGFQFDMCIFFLLFPPYISLSPLLRVSIITCITIGAVRTKAWPGDEQAPGVLGKVKYSLISIEMAECTVIR